MREDVLESVCELECLDVAESVLHVRIHDQLDQTQDFATQMECIAKSAFLSLFGREGFHWF